MFYDMDWNMNSSSNELNSYMKDFILIFIMLLGFWFRKKPCVGYLYKILRKWNGLGVYPSLYNFLTHQNMNSYCSSCHTTSRNWSKPKKWCFFLFNMKIVYTASWSLFVTPDYLVHKLVKLYASKYWMYWNHSDVQNVYLLVIM